MSGPAPYILVLTLVAALVAGAYLGSDTGLVNIYHRNVGSAEWNRESVPIDRLLAIVADREGLSRLAAERTPLRQALSEVEVDFETDVLLVAYMGAMPTGGHSIHVTDVQALTDREGRPARVSVRLAVASPSESDVTTQAFTYPVDVVSIRREAWPQDILAAVMSGALGVEASDQDGRDWGPVIVYPVD